MLDEFEPPEPDAPASVWLKFVLDVLHEYAYEVRDEPDDDESDWQHRKANLTGHGVGRAWFLINEYIYPYVYTYEGKSDGEIDLIDDGPHDWSEPQPGETYTPIGYEDTDGTA